MVRQTGLEPVRQRHTPLKRACLPIPALPHNLKCFNIIAIEINFVKGFLGKSCVSCRNSTEFKQKKNEECSKSKSCQKFLLFVGGLWYNNLDIL